MFKALSMQPGDVDQRDHDQHEEKEDKGEGL
jgi:hypothetical protein